jgi:membrane-associated phospholipid phosphatase
MKRLAVVVSAIIHPLLMPLLSVFIAFNFDWYLSGRMIPEQENVIYIIVALSTMAFPGLNILLLKWYGVVRSLSMPVRKERIAPFISSLFFFGLGYYLLRKGTIPNTVYSIYLGSFFTLISLSLINFKWKISAHAAGISGVLGMTLALFRIHDYANLWLLGILIIAAGLTLSSRLILNAHTPAQVYTGAGIGFLIPYVCISWEIVI